MALLGSNASPNAIMEGILRMQRRFIVFSDLHESARSAERRRARSDCRQWRQPGVKERPSLKIEVVPAGGTGAANY